MAKIVPNIWCNGTAEEAAAFYASVFPRTRGAVIASYPDEGLPDFQREMAGKPLMAEVVIDGYQLMLINAGHEFSPNESITFLLNFDPDRDPTPPARSTRCGPAWSTAARWSGNSASTRSARATAGSATATASPGNCC